MFPDVLKSIQFRTYMEQTNIACWINTQKYDAQQHIARINDKKPLVLSVMSQSQNGKTARLCYKKNTISTNSVFKLIQIHEI